MPATNAVIDLADYRRQRQQRVEPKAAPLPAAGIVWVMVPVFYFPGRF